MKAGLSQMRAVPIRYGISHYFWNTHSSTYLLPSMITGPIFALFCTRSYMKEVPPDGVL